MLTLISHGGRPLSVSRSWTQRPLFVAETRLIILRPPPHPCLYSNDAETTLARKRTRSCPLFKHCDAVPACCAFRPRLGLKENLVVCCRHRLRPISLGAVGASAAVFRDVNRNRSRFSARTQREEVTARAPNCGDTSLQKAQQRPEEIHEHRCRVLERVLLLTRNP